MNFINKCLHRSSTKEEYLEERGVLILDFKNELYKSMFYKQKQ